QAEPRRGLQRLRRFLLGGGARAGAAAPAPAQLTENRVEIVCPRCGTRQPEGSISFECVKCGADLAGQPTEPTPLHPPPEMLDRSVLRSGLAERAVQAVIVIGLAVAMVWVAVRWLAELFIDTTAVQQAMDDGPV